MPSLRKRVAGFMRQLSITNLTAAIENIGHGENSLHSTRSPTSDISTGCFVSRYLNSVEEKCEGPLVLHGRNPDELPVRTLAKLDSNEEIFAAITGPDRGLTTVNLKQKHLSISDPDVDYIDILDHGIEQNDQPTSAALNGSEIAGVDDWFLPHDMAYGTATTLYEKNPTNNVTNGEPIADCFAVAARPNAAILALADGVNWGSKASIAARSAVHGSVEYLNKALFSSPLNANVTTTRDVFVALLRSFHAAHSLILQEQGMLTTLTVCAVLPVMNNALSSSSSTSSSSSSSSSSSVLSTSGSNSKSKKYVACTCNVGDSLAYVYSKKTGVREITRGSHNIHCMRDMRDALGALGPVDGCNPELNNLTLAMTEVERDDIVFLTSDGISDNFDPVVGKFAILPSDNSGHCSFGGGGGGGGSNKDGNFDIGKSSDGRQIKNHKKSDNLRRVHSSGNGDHSHSHNNDLPIVQAYQRHELTLLRMEDLLSRGVSGDGPPCQSAKQLCELLLDFAVRITAAKRRILEDTDLYYAQQKNGELIQLSKPEQRSRRKKMLDKMSMVPGKLDHATIVAYVVGSYKNES